LKRVCYPLENAQAILKNSFTHDSRLGITQFQAQPNHRSASELSCS
jgi:hypothetical protein